MFASPTPLRHSVSQQMHGRFARHALRRNVVAWLYVALYSLYLGWRATIINPESLTLSLVYFAAECLGFILGLNIIATSRRYQHHAPPAAPAGLAVDVLLPTYKEPIEIIRQTAIAAQKIRYPHRTIILDDGKRDEVRALAEELGIRYLSRPQNTDAKAGNLNFGLAHSEAEFVMVFDADHMAMPHALDATLGFFADPQVAMVQTAQEYYNTDAFQYMCTREGGIWNDQSFFFNIAQPCRDSDNGASCVGTGVVYRRSAIDDIGGIPPDTVTEDVQTSLKMHKRGMRVIYLNEPVSYGIAEADLAEYYKTRQRWAHGNLHALVRERVLTCKGLSWRQRLSYLSLGLVYLEGWQQLLLFAIPLGSLVFGLQPFEISIFNILMVLLFPFANYALLQELGCGFARFWANELFAMARWPVYLLSTAGLFGRPLAWRSSRKTIQAQVNWRLMMPQISVLLLSLGALVYAAFRLGGNFQVGPVFHFVASILLHGSAPSGTSLFATLPAGYTLDLVAVAGFWALYNATRAAFFVAKTIGNAKRSHRFFRFDLPLAARLTATGEEARVEAISEVWCRLLCYQPQPDLRHGIILPVTLHLPAGVLELHMRVEKTTQINSQTHIEGSWIWGGHSKRDRLAAALYSLDWQRELGSRHAYFHTPLEYMTRLFTRRREQRQPFAKQHWHPVLYSASTDPRLPSHYAVLATDSSQPDHSALLTFQHLNVGEVYHGHRLGTRSPDLVEFRIYHEEPVTSLALQGLDGAMARRYRIGLVSVIEKPRPMAIMTENRQSA